MNNYDMYRIDRLLAGNTYAGRGIVVGMTEDGKHACAAYFIMGRSANSRNRVFVEKNGEVFTEPFDASKVIDPSLIIYAAVRQYQNQLIVTNGNQTDTIYDGLAAGMSFSKALESRCFEPDAPNYTPRISAVVHLDAAHPSYEMSILKSIDAEGSDCARYTFSYPMKAGLGHFLHTYVCDGNPLPTFLGEPERVRIENDLDVFANKIWRGLDVNNRISLYVRFVDLATGEFEDRIINKNEKEHEA